MALKICHAVVGENSRSTGGKAGDQTGKEVRVDTWYSKNWNCMLRYKDAKVAKIAAEIGKQLAESNLVGYNQDERNTLYKSLKAFNFDYVAYIKSGIKSNTDCSAFVYAIWCCLIPELRYDGNAPTTATMKSFYEKHGFTAYTDVKYLTTDVYLKKGDFLVRPFGHTLMIIEDGLSTKETVEVPAIALPTVRKGTKGLGAKNLQLDLNYIDSAGLTVDGDFGAKSTQALKNWQAKYGLEADGIYGHKSYEKMRKLIKG